MKIIMLTDALVGSTALSVGDVVEVDRDTYKRLVGKGSAAPAPEPESAPPAAPAPAPAPAPEPRPRPRAATPGA